VIQFVAHHARVEARVVGDDRPAADPLREDRPELAERRAASRPGRVDAVDRLEAHGAGAGAPARRRLEVDCDSVVVTRRRHVPILRCAPLRLRSAQPDRHPPPRSDRRAGRLETPPSLRHGAAVQDAARADSVL